MIDNVKIREALPSDAPLIERLYRDAFPDEDLLPLVRDLQKTCTISLVGFVDSALVCHAVFTTCSVAGRPDKAALLGPVAVAPKWQRQGLGSAIVRVGLRLLESTGTAHVYVLGDPAYYSRFGFEPDDNVTPPYPLPEEWLGAWQSLNLSNDNPSLRGKLSVPQAWCRRALWVP